MSEDVEWRRKGLSRRAAKSSSAAPGLSTRSRRGVRKETAPRCALSIYSVVGGLVEAGFFDVEELLSAG